MKLIQELKKLFEAPAEFTIDDPADSKNKDTIDYEKLKVNKIDKDSVKTTGHGSRSSKAAIDRAGLADFVMGVAGTKSGTIIKIDGNIAHVRIRSTKDIVTVKLDSLKLEGEFGSVKKKDAAIDAKLVLPSNQGNDLVRKYSIK